MSSIWKWVRITAMYASMILKINTPASSQSCLPLYMSAINISYTRQQKSW